MKVFDFPESSEDLEGVKSKSILNRSKNVANSNLSNHFHNHSNQT